MQMRGGTSKGLYFLADDLPADAAERDDLLLRVMGSPDPRQIDGVGGAHPLTSKVAVVAPSARAGIDVDYLFLQVMVDQAIVTDKQNCGNILAGVGPFAVERGLVPARGDETPVRDPDGEHRRDRHRHVPHPGRRAPLRRGHRDRRRAGHGGGGRARLRGLRAGASVFPTGNVTDMFGGVSGDLRRQRDAGRRGGRRQLRQDGAGVGRRA